MWRRHAVSWKGHNPIPRVLLVAFILPQFRCRPVLSDIRSSPGGSTFQWIGGFHSDKRIHKYMGVNEWLVPFSEYCQNLSYVPMPCRYVVVGHPRLYRGCTQAKHWSNPSQPASQLAAVVYYERWICGMLKEWNTLYIVVERKISFFIAKKWNSIVEGFILLNGFSVRMFILPGVVTWWMVELSLPILICAAMYGFTLLIRFLVMHSVLSLLEGITQVGKLKLKFCILFNHTVLLTAKLLRITCTYPLHICK